MLLLLLLFLSLVASEKIDINYAVKYMERFGYFNKSKHDVTDMISILRDFQEKFNLLVDGTLNPETIQLLERPRCSVGENYDGEHSYSVRTKWKKTNLTWYFPQATPPYVAAAEKAFNIWQENSKFTFKGVTILT
ncbi:matrix metalloproteinase-18-like [Diorhabda sublineata]|uniref:matrix metalloproteinase-18-like n=1 Tax=Diorhabda sublineata TaxID=1163346 RepID=UPI0024E090D4|nr:matrix metalloproteinase-18-like [Diorhabda sublineata]